MENQTFESALAELDKIVRQLEEGKTPLEESIAAYERGVSLKNFCDEKLRNAQLTIEKITVGQDGVLATEPFGKTE